MDHGWFTICGKKRAKSRNIFCPVLYREEVFVVLFSLNKEKFTKLK
jgi:hypothetical protein